MAMMIDQLNFSAASFSPSQWFDTVHAQHPMGVSMWCIMYVSANLKQIACHAKAYDVKSDIHDYVIVIQFMNDMRMRSHVIFDF